MAYSGIVELLGIKELAEHDSFSFKRKLRDFKEHLESTSVNYEATEKADVYVYNFRDYCYLQCASLSNIITFLKFLQLSMIKDTSFSIKSVITYGELEFEDVKMIDKKPSKASPDFLEKDVLKNNHTESFTVFQNITYSSLAAKLYGIIERFKGIGIFVDLEGIEDGLPESELNAWKRSSNLFFDNFYIADLYKMKYEHFIDCRLTRGDYSNSDFDISHLMHVLEVQIKKSTRIARFYIPILINIINNYDLDLLDETDAKNFFIPILTKLKTLSGVELVYFALVNKFFEKRFMNMHGLEDVNESWIKEIQLLIAKNKSFREAFSNESKQYNIPREILTYSRKKAILERLYTLAL